MHPLLESTCAQLGIQYGAAGIKAAEGLRRWLSGSMPYAEAETVAQHLGDLHIPLLFDAFWQVLPFGTGGRRGRVGYGSNRLNRTTLAMTVQGHCDYLRARFVGRTDLSVVVANDVRVFNDATGTYQFLGQSHPLRGLSSRQLAWLACEIYAGNGIAVVMPAPEDPGGVLSTPELAFLIARLGASGGINVSASHNPPDDNGVKIYDEFGSQPVAPQDQALLDVMAQVTAVKTIPFAQARREGLIQAPASTLHDGYLAGYQTLYGNFFAPRADVPIVYTPLCGVGLSTAGALLTRLGFPVLVPPDEGPDGSFSVIPFRSPNPEVPQSTGPARRFAEAHGSAIVLSSDPDADRIGCEVRLEDGQWCHLDGNQIAAILCYALMLDPEGPRRAGLVIETLVTTRLLGRIVAARGDSDIIDDLLVGFKYVADVLKQLARDGHYGSIRRRPEELVLAVEESHGVIGLPTILDKDSTPACMYLAGLHQRLTCEGRTLLDYYIAILEQLGGFETASRSITMAGASGLERKDRIMATLRQQPPVSMAGYKVVRMADHWDEEAFGPLLSDSERLPRNVIQITTDRFVLTVRPSGTEPKLKFYCELLPGHAPLTTKGRPLLAQLREEADALARLVYGDLLGRIDVTLGEVGLLLSDIIELDRKCEFETRVVPLLKLRLGGAGKETFAALLSWLGQEAATLLPGADPLPALRAPLAHLARRWRNELGGSSLFGELERWANTP